MANKDHKKPSDDAPSAVSNELYEPSKRAFDANNRHIKQSRDVLQSGETNPARQAICEKTHQAWETIKRLTAPVSDVFKRANNQEGTQLRKYLGAARESLNAQVYAAQMQLQKSKKIADDQMVPVKGVLGAAQQQLVKANEFRREQPEMAVASLVALVGVPSLLLRGKWSAVRILTPVVGISAAACYGLDKWTGKKRN